MAQALNLMHGPNIHFIIITIYMYKIAGFAGVGGVLLAILSKVAILSHWNLESFFRLLGLTGYILIISSVAYFTLLLMNKLYKREAVRSDY